MPHRARTALGLATAALVAVALPTLAEAKGGRGFGRMVSSPRAAPTPAPAAPSFAPGGASFGSSAARPAPAGTGFGPSAARAAPAAPPAQRSGTTGVFFFSSGSRPAAQPAGQAPGAEPERARPDGFWTASSRPAPVPASAPAPQQVAARPQDEPKGFLSLAAPTGSFSVVTPGGAVPAASARP